MLPFDDDRGVGGFKPSKVRWEHAPAAIAIATATIVLSPQRYVGNEREGLDPPGYQARFKPSKVRWEPTFCSMPIARTRAF